MIKDKVADIVEPIDTVFAQVACPTRLLPGHGPLVSRRLKEAVTAFVLQSHRARHPKEQGLSQQP
jgi:hypothetical protein